MAVNAIVFGKCSVCVFLLFVGSKCSVSVCKILWQGTGRPITKKEADEEWSGAQALRGKMLEFLAENQECRQELEDSVES